VLIWTGSYSSLASPESETAPNALILIGHNVQGDLARLEEMKISECHPVLSLELQMTVRLLSPTLVKNFLIIRLSLTPWSLNVPYTPTGTGVSC
jgi:hypothetical protein